MDNIYIKSLIQKILDKEFSSKHRRKINDFSDRLNFCAPCCGDGKSEFKKRGNLYLNKLKYICFNCGTSMTLDRLCKVYNEQIDPDKKLEMIEHLDSVITYNDYQDDVIETSYENLINLSDIQDVIIKNLTPFSDFEPIKKNGGIYKYLCNRGISEKYHENIYQAKYWRNDDEFDWVIVMLNRKGDKILGMQIRNLKEGKRRVFKIYNYESLLEWINMGRVEQIEIDPTEMVIYNKLSYFFNILNINFSSRITVFEGYLDSLFFPNSIGMVGVNTDSRFLENNGLEIQYFFDNDDAGFKKSEEKLKEGYSIFLWNKLFASIVDSKKSNDPYRLEYRISKVKDINKLDQLVTDSYMSLKLQTFFSSDVMDLKWIPKIKYGRKEKDKDYNRKFEDFNKV